MKQADFLKRGVTVDNMVDLQDSFEKAHEDDTPFPIVTKDEVRVVGDANRTEVKSRDYSIRFRFPKDMPEVQRIDPNEILKTVGNYVIVRFEFKDVRIKPRYDLEIIAAISRIFPYLYSINEDTKNLEKRSKEEMTDIIDGMCQTIGDDLYHVAGAILGVDKGIEDYMMWNDVVDFVTNVPRDFPELINETEGFTE